MQKGFSVSAGGVVLNPKAQVLVVSQEGTSWSLPKGHIEKGEEKLTSAKREIYEETGLSDLGLIKGLGNFVRPKIGDRTEIKRIYLYLFKTKQDKLKPVDSHHPEARRVDIDEVASILSAPKDKEFFLKIKSQL